MTEIPVRPLLEAGFRFRPLLAEYASEASARFGSFVASLLKPLSRGLADQRFEGYVAGAGGRAAGAIVYGSYKGTARISLLHVANQWRNQGIEEQLLDAALRDLCSERGYMRQILAEAMVVSHADPDALFAGRGFGVVPRLVMRASLPRPAARSRLVLNEDVLTCDGRPLRLRGWLSGDARPVTQVLCRANASSVDRDIYPELLDEEQAGAAVRGISAGSCGRFDRRCTGVAVTPHGQSVGVLLCSRSGPGQAFVVELAIDPAWQGCGVGTALLGRTLKLLARLGVSDVSLGVTCSNTAALRLYERAGFRPAGEFSSYSWSSGVDADNVYRPA